jgi:hypothetical protein
MSKLIIGLTFAFAAFSGAIAAGKAIPAFQPARLLSESCALGEIARAGELTYLARQDAWFSARGQVFRITGCPMPRMALRGA